MCLDKSILLIWGGVEVYDSGPGFGGSLPMQVLICLKGIQPEQRYWLQEDKTKTAMGFLI